jgi:hypothetical protein
MGHELMLGDSVGNQLNKQCIPDAAKNSDDEGEQQPFSWEWAQNEIEWLQERVNSLQAYLCYQSQELDELKQELHAVNRSQELMNCEIQQMIATELLTFDQAKRVAAEILVESKPTREALARLLSAVYSKAVSPEDLTEKQESSRQESTGHTRSPQDADYPPPPAKFLPGSAELQEQCAELGILLAEFTVILAKIQTYLNSA